MRNDHLWWCKDRDHGDDVAASVFAALDDIRQQDGTRVDDLDAWSSIYNDRPCEHFGRIDFYREGKSRMPALPGMVDSTLSRIGRARPVPMVLTTDGDWKRKRRAKLLSRWLGGMFKKLDVHELMKGVLHDAIVLGTGVVKSFYDHEAAEICVERVWPGDMFVHPIEAQRNCVRTLYQVVPVDRRTLADQYEKHADWICEYAPKIDSTSVTTTHTDLVEVVEAWRLGTKTTPGRHVVTLKGRVLLDEKWTARRFPFEFLHWRRLHRSFWGQGMVESGAGLQSMINETATTMEECFRLSFPCIMVETGSKVRVESLDNTPWTVLEYTGVPPQFSTPPPFHPAYHEYLSMLRATLFESQGVSELAASSHKPAGLNSGKALLVFQDVESERFLIQGRAFEDIHVSLAERIIAIAEEVYATKPEAECLRALGGRKGLEALEFGDVRMADDQWEIQVYPVTSLSHSPSGRLEQIQELLQMGIITDPAVARELLDYPDLERYTSVESARRDLAEKLIAHALDTGEAKPANPYMDLPYALKRGVLEHNLAEMDDAPASSLDALRMFIGHCEELIRQEEEAAANEAMQAQAAAAPPPPMGPDAMGPDMGADMMAGAGML